MMTTQFVEYAAILGTLVFMEGVLAADNALVLAVLVSRLPNKDQQKKALLYGIVGAFVFRGISVLAAKWLISIWYFKAGGALYLMYITAHYFLSGGHKEDHTKGPTADDREGKGVARFWPTVVLVELTDIAFSVDQIVAAISLSDELWLIYTGGMMGVVAMRYAAGVFLRVIDKHPRLAYTGHILPAWIGVKLAVKTLADAPFDWPISMPPWLFWPVLVGIVVWGLISGRAPQNEKDNAETA
ncbi:MAG: hypothetical protein QGH20_00105 [Candidatus Latescibacteria bacterium]|jgi:YkoY family integral membrane protein|nr:hypothetical protein [Candidatus Latescibacterota bacterium]